ncbi:hypothetical protein FJR38_27395 [Anabaena sp. UHCC 0253]|nr:hypothetical protein [Anabaena sp. UHCC 0253]
MVEILESRNCNLIPYSLKIKFRNSFNKANASCCGEAFTALDLVAVAVLFVFSDTLPLAVWRVLPLVRVLAIAI